MIQVGQLPRHDVALVDEQYAPIASRHPTLSSPLQLILDKHQRPLEWFDPHRRIALPITQPLAALHSLRFAYSALLDAPGGVLVHVDDSGKYQGAVSYSLLQHVLDGLVEIRRYG
ncbi:Uncharacterised protein [Raoultella terrigena]|uniref:Uncharacterized protein n=1 Tax=Raoultella terrigena TaxID=577 RepID=A0A3P8M1T2_RAOTE|nr:Uncharacterised protein [Raoultella terrigena]